MSKHQELKHQELKDQELEAIVGGAQAQQGSSSIQSGLEEAQAGTGHGPKVSDVMGL